MSDYHVPVMLGESIEALDIRPDGVYVDLTFGGGGHSRGILERIEKGHLYAFDQDRDAEANAREIEKRSFTFIRANFRYLKKYLKIEGIGEVDGIFGDLGISSHQIDEASRGFSTRAEGNLDMRMNQDLELTAEKWLREVEEEELQKVLSEYGEVRNAKSVARVICSARVSEPIKTTTHLTTLLRHLAPRGRESKFFAQVFQAIRIRLNDELIALEEVLDQGTQLLKNGGRFVMLTYHSLEDRLVKNFFKSGNVSGRVEKDLYGHLIRPLEPVRRKPITASAEEISLNKRSRSAKLRVAQKV